MIPFTSGLINIAAARSVVSSPGRPGGSPIGSISLTLLLLLAILCLSSSLPSLGQATTGSIVGTVTDPSKAVIPDADVTVTNLSTGVTSSTKSNYSGHYEFLSLPAGQYTESVLHAGFSSTVCLTFR